MFTALHKFQRDLEQGARCLGRNSEHYREVEIFFFGSVYFFRLAARLYLEERGGERERTQERD